MNALQIARQKGWKEFVAWLESYKRAHVEKFASDGLFSFFGNSVMGTHMGNNLLNEEQLRIQQDERQQQEARVQYEEQVRLDQESEVRKHLEMQKKLQLAEARNAQLETEKKLALAEARNAQLESEKKLAEVRLFQLEKEKAEAKPLRTVPKRLSLPPISPPPANMSTGRVSPGRNVSPGRAISPGRDDSLRIKEMTLQHKQEIQNQLKEFGGSTEINRIEMRLRELEALSSGKYKDLEKMLAQVELEQKRHLQGE
jgi:hypothetical protein